MMHPRLLPTFICVLRKDGATMRLLIILQVLIMVCRSLPLIDAETAYMTLQKQYGQSKKLLLQMIATTILSKPKLVDT